MAYRSGEVCSRVRPRSAVALQLDDIGPLRCLERRGGQNENAPMHHPDASTGDPPHIGMIYRRIRSFRALKNIALLSEVFFTGTQIAPHMAEFREASAASRSHWETHHA